MTILILRIYSFLLGFYPATFRAEFREQMLLDFSDMVADAGINGNFSLLRFCVRELFDFPVNLLHVHWKEDRMFKLLRSQPVTIGFRNALVFGLAFGSAGIIARFIDLKLVLPDRSIFSLLSVGYYDLFHTEHGLDFISWLPSALTSLLTGLMIGAVFAFLFADRSNWVKYLLVSMISWFLFQEVFRISFYATNLPFYLGTRHYIIFSYVSYILAGTFLGLIFYVAKSEKRLPFRLLCIGLFAYPLTAYLYIKLLLKLLIVETPWMFVAMMVLWVIFIGSVFVIAVISAPVKKIPWLVILSGVVVPLLPWIGHWFVYLIALLFGQINFPREIPVESPLIWTWEFRVALDQTVYGILFGLIIGIGFGLLHKRSDQHQIASV